MSSPVATLSKFEPTRDFLDWEPAVSPNRKASFQSVPDKLLAASSNIPLGNFKYTSDNHDRKLSDYLFLGVLSFLVHTTVVDQFDHIALEQEIIEPAKPLPQVQISLSRPQPKPVAPPPPLAKPKPVQKVVEEVPTPAPMPVIDNAPAVSAPAPAAPPAPVVEEKVTAPSAGADYLNNPAPESPEIAMDRGWEGKVLMKVHVQPDGRPDSVSVIKSSGQKVLDDAAVKTVNKWSFVPAKRGDTPIAGWVTVPITFNLS